MVFHGGEGGEEGAAGAQVGLLLPESITPKPDICRGTLLLRKHHLLGPCSRWGVFDEQLDRVFFFSFVTLQIKVK